MTTIFVKTAADRIAFADEAGTKRIPTDRYIPVKQTPWINSRLAVGDIEKRPDGVTATPSGAGDASQSASPKRSRSGQ